MTDKPQSSVFVRILRKQTSVLLNLKNCNPRVATVAGRFRPAVQPWQPSRLRPRMYSIEGMSGAADPKRRNAERVQVPPGDDGSDS